MQSAPELLTDRLRLRGWTVKDRAPFAALNADPAVMEHFPSTLDRAASDALVDRIVAGFAADGFGLWAVELRDEQRFIGFVGLSRVAFEAAFTPAVEIGWRLAHDAWGAGYATEAGRAALNFALGPLGLDEVVSFTTVGNTRSRDVMQRLGMHNHPADDFDHPRLPAAHPLRRHVLYRHSRRPPAGSSPSPPGHHRTPP